MSIIDLEGVLVLDWAESGSHETIETRPQSLWKTVRPLTRDIDARKQRPYLLLLANVAYTEEARKICFQQKWSTICGPTWLVAHLAPSTDIAVLALELRWVTNGLLHLLALHFLGNFGSAPRSVHFRDPVLAD